MSYHPGRSQELLQDLKAFKQKHGHCHVPRRHKDNPQLGCWVAHMQHNFQLQMQGKDLQLERTPEMVAAFELFSADHNNNVENRPSKRVKMEIQPREEEEDGRDSKPAAVLSASNDENKDANDDDILVVWDGVSAGSSVSTFSDRVSQLEAAICLGLDNVDENKKINPFERVKRIEREFSEERAPVRSLLGILDYLENRFRSLGFIPSQVAFENQHRVRAQLDEENREAAAQRVSAAKSRLLAAKEELLAAKGELLAALPEASDVDEQIENNESGIAAVGQLAGQGDDGHSQPRVDQSHVPSVAGANLYARGVPYQIIGHSQPRVNQPHVPSVAGANLCARGVPYQIIGHSQPRVSQPYTTRPGPNTVGGLPTHLLGDDNMYAQSHVPSVAGANLYARGVPYQIIFSIVTTDWPAASADNLWSEMKKPNAAVVKGWLTKLVRGGFQCNPDCPQLFLAYYHDRSVRNKNGEIVSGNKDNTVDFLRAVFGVEKRGGGGAL